MLQNGLGLSGAFTENRIVGKNGGLLGAGLRQFSPGHPMNDSVRLFGVHIRFVHRHCGEMGRLRKQKVQHV